MRSFPPFLRFPKSKSHSYLRPSSRAFSSQQTQFENVGPMASMLNSRAVVRFKGPDSVKFLQAMVTNDLRLLGEPEGKTSSTLAPANMSMASVPPVYAAMLTPQGRFLYDMFIYRPSRSDEKLDQSGSGPGTGAGELELFADVDRSVLDELLATLKKYRLRSNVEFESVADDFSCWQRYGGSLSKESFTEEPDAAGIGWGASVDLSDMSGSQTTDRGWQWHKDPRLCCLGFRGIFPSNTTPPLVEADKETDERNYLLWRLEKGVAEGSTEIPKGEAIALEYNLTGLNAINFDKGCYVGQELIARIHHRGVIRKRLLPLKFLNNSGQDLVEKVAPGAEVINTESSKKVGAITTTVGSRGLGLLRLEDAFKGSGTLRIQAEEDVKVEVVRPEWWPAEWFQEHEQVSATA